MIELRFLPLSFYYLKIWFVVLIYMFNMVSCSTNSPGTEIIEEEDQSELPGDGPSTTNTRFTATISLERIALSTYYAGFNGRSTEGPSWTDSDFLQLVNKMSPASIRYPGGTLGNSWDWRKGGLLDKVPKYPFYIKDFVAGLPRQDTQVIYMMNMVKPTPSTGYSGNESLEILKSEAVLQAKIIDALDALEEFARYGCVPIALELGNELYFNNEHAGIYAANATLYLDHALIIARAVKQKYPQMYILLCTTKGGTSGRDLWNTAVYTRLATNQELRSLIHGTVQHHYISENYGSQEPITTLDAAESAIEEGLSYTTSSRTDYEDVPAGLKLWITEFGVSKKKEEGGMWAVGLQYLAMSMGWLELGNKIENVLCQHITLEPGVIDKSRMKIGSVGITYGEFMRATSGKHSAYKISFHALREEDEILAAELHAWKFVGEDEDIILLLNATRNMKQDIDLTSVLPAGDIKVTFKQYWSETPYQNSVFENEGIQVGIEGHVKSFQTNPFSLSVITIQKKQK